MQQAAVNISFKRYNAEQNKLRKDRAKKKNRIPIRLRVEGERIKTIYYRLGEGPVDKQELISRLEKLGIKISSPNTLRLWERQGLIPEGKQINSKRKEYPDEALGEAYAYKSMKLPPVESAEIRKAVLKMEGDAELLRGVFSPPKEDPETGIMKFHPAYSEYTRVGPGGFAGIGYILQWIENRAYGEVGPLPLDKAPITVYDINIDTGKIKRKVELEDVRPNIAHGGVMVRVWEGEE